MPSFTEDLLDENTYGPSKPLESDLNCGAHWYFGPSGGIYANRFSSQAQKHICYEAAPRFPIFFMSKPYPLQNWEDWYQATSRVRFSDPLVASAHDLSEVLLEVNDLAFEEEEDQFGLVRPSYHGYKHCMGLLLLLAKSGKLLKPSDVTTDHNGDIRIAWAKGSNEAELVCPSEGLPYLYFSSGEDYGTDPDVTIEKIAERARWAIDGK